MMGSKICEYLTGVSMTFTWKMRGASQDCSHPNHACWLPLENTSYANDIKSVCRQICGSDHGRNMDAHSLDVFPQIRNMFLSENARRKDYSTRRFRHYLSSTIPIATITDISEHPLVLNRFSQHRPSLESA
eukprot:TRINITY_DN2085_c0_g1_i2.p1 TRINITY_DN2085_c0_g1~~TRINITY_DN2085_c0_g1_i2.p1  ORF type:complete len:131 (-),score=17.96 TRINITY_DN2085_c0_g1_i2:164-556(-)